MTAEILAAAALAVWLYLLFARGGFWLCRERDDWQAGRPRESPSVAIVVPARNEADQIAASIGSLLKQDYAGPCTIILVDDQSSDGTAAIAEAQVGTCGPEKLRVVASGGVPSGWTGKLWAIKQGISAAMALPQPPEYLLLTDADIVHAPETLSGLVEHARARGLVLTSLMAKLRCESVAERVNIPAFIFFFQMLYPFAWVNRPQAASAAAAGGCMLVRADALARSGGIEAIRGALIDDCALAKVLKRHGPIWLGLSQRVRSIRAYASFSDTRQMVVRSAYAQLGYSPLLLMSTIAGLIVTYVVPPLIALLGTGVARAMALMAWGCMAFAFQPILRFYRLSPLWGLALPAIALQYLILTLDSAYQYMQGRGGAWKGRVQAKY